MLPSPEFEPGNEALFESEGYRAFRYAFTMIHRHVRDAEPIAMPEGFEIRPVTPDQHRQIFDADDHSPDTEGVREFTRRITTDPGWIASLVPVRDGVIVAYKK